MQTIEQMFEKQILPYQTKLLINRNVTRPNFAKTFNCY